MPLILIFFKHQTNLNPFEDQLEDEFEEMNSGKDCQCFIDLNLNSEMLDEPICSILSLFQILIT